MWTILRVGRQSLSSRYRRVGPLCTRNQGSTWGNWSRSSETLQFSTMALLPKKDSSLFESLCRSSTTTPLVELRQPGVGPGGTHPHLWYLPNHDAHNTYRSLSGRMSPQASRFDYHTRSTLNSQQSITACNASAASVN
jgi:hypothetical protein